MIKIKNLQITFKIMYKEFKKIEWKEKKKLKYVQVLY